MVETWVLFFLLITAPTQYQVHPLESFHTAKAEKDCKYKAAEVMANLKTVYTLKAENDTYIAVCLKQLEIEA